MKVWPKEPEIQPASQVVDSKSRVLCPSKLAFRGRSTTLHRPYGVLNQQAGIRSSTAIPGHLFVYAN
jgi:hypothetical protein